MQKNIRSKFLKCITPLLFILLFSGCSIWHNFTTYYNLYYNLSDLFEQAETAINAQNKGLFDIEDKRIPNNASQLLASVIEKSSKLLQFHSDTKYVDNALLILGKAFYYQGNYTRALRKFQELKATQPESDYLLEADLWIGKCLIKLREYDKAFEVLNSVQKIAKEEDEELILRDAFVEEIKYYLSKENYSQAIGLIKQLLLFYEDDELDAEIAFELGKIYMLNGDTPNAVTAFQSVFEYSPTFEIDFSAKIELAKALRLNNQAELSLEILDELASDEKYKEDLDQIELQKGLALNSLGKTRQAIDMLIKVDTVYTRSISSSLARFELAKIYESEIVDYDSASIYYLKVTGSSIGDRDQIIEANSKATKFKKYQYLKSEIVRLNRDLNYVRNPEVFLQDSIKFAADTAKIREQNLNERDKRVNRKSNPAASRIAPKRPNISADSIMKSLVKTEYDLGNLFFAELNAPDSAYFYYTDILDSAPDSILGNYKAKLLFNLGSYFLLKNDTTKADSLFEIVYNNFQDQSIANEAAIKLNKKPIESQKDKAAELYAKAEEKLLAEKVQKLPDEFYSIYKNFPNSPIAPKALYAAGWVLENKLHLNDSAAVFYDSLMVLYPRTEYARSVRQSVIAYRNEQRRIKLAIQDSIKRIERMKANSLKQDSLMRVKGTVISPQNNVKQNKNVEDLIKTRNSKSVKDSLDRLRMLELERRRRGAQTPYPDSSKSK